MAAGALVRFSTTLGQLLEWAGVSAALLAVREEDVHAVRAADNEALPAVRVVQHVVADDAGNRRAIAVERVETGAAVDEVVAGLAFDPVIPTVAVERVATATTLDRVIARSTVDDVRIRITRQDVVARATPEVGAVGDGVLLTRDTDLSGAAQGGEIHGNRYRTVAVVEVVRARRRGRRRVTGRAEAGRIHPRTSHDAVEPVAVDDVVAGSARHEVVAIPAVERIDTASADEVVVPRSAVEGVTDCRTRANERVVAAHAE